MEIVITAPAQRALNRLPRRDAERLQARFAAIAADAAAGQPGWRHAGVAALGGTDGIYRVRQGDWRAVFHFDFSAAPVMLVTAVGHRREIYG